MFKRVCFLIFAVSPLLYLTGGIEHVTPLSIANYLHAPSLSFINYMAFIFLCFYAVLKSLNNLSRLMPTVLVMVIVSCVLFRTNSTPDVLISFASQLLIIAPVFVLIGCNIGLDKGMVKKIVNLYFLYIVLSIVLHYVFLSYYMIVGTFLPNERAVGIFKNPNHFSAFAILTLILFYQLTLQKMYPRNTVFVAELIIGLVVYITGSRSAQLFFFALVLIHSFAYNRKLFISYLTVCCLSILFLLSSNIGLEKIENLLTKRETKDIAEAGNMRIAILFEMIRNFSAVEFLLGKGSGEGTAVFISSQISQSRSVVWLDSNINTLTYTYGMVFTGLVYISMLFRFFYIYKRKVVNTYSLLFIMYFMWFINIGEFFPLIFMLLLPVLNDKENESNDINNNRLL